jgi:hypothetical protein
LNIGNFPAPQIPVRSSNSLLYDCEKLEHLFWSEGKSMGNARKIFLGFIAILVAVAVMNTAALAQKAPAPPTAADWAALAKLPDFTGVWEVGLGGGGARGAATASAGAQAVTPPAARGAAPAGARGGGAAGPQLTPEYAAKRDALRAQAREDNETANCLPPGMPGIMNQPYPMEFLLTPGKMTIVIEAYTQVRHIYTDGRKLPEDPDEKFFGTSIGHWEGDTLVAETVGFSPLTQIAAGIPHSESMKILERFRLTDPDTMTIETTITDSKALTAPFVSSRTLKRHRNWTIAEYICEENNHNFVDSSGKAGIKLDKP